MPTREPVREPMPAAPAAPPWHAWSADAVWRQLSVDPAQGLAPQRVETLQREHGANVLREPPPRPAWRVFARQLQSPLIYLLLVAAALAVSMDHDADAAVIVVVVLVNALVGSVQEGRAERSMAALRRLAALRARVLRDGREQWVTASEIVPGDIVLLAGGDAVAADARLIEGAQLQVAEAALTGESLPVFKTAAPLPEDTLLADRANMVYAGTHVADGRASAVVVATGHATEMGRVAELAEAGSEPRTPLERRLERFGRQLVVAALVLFALVMVLGLWRGLPVAELAMVAISQMVSMVPEGLPVAMTVALAVGMQRMAARGAIIRRLSAVETLGSTTVICTDKTGTLTRNEMSAVALWLPPGRRIAVSGSGYAPLGELREAGRPAALADPDLQALLQAAALCNDAELLPPGDERAGWSALGDPTEAALLALAGKAGLDRAVLRRDAAREAELPFDAQARLMATRHRVAGGPRRVFVKGSPEAVLALCGGADGDAVRDARAEADAMASQALRVLAFAAVDDDALEAAPGFAALAGRARLLGLIGQIDPPRETAREAVAACRAAGIRPVMVTGDHRLTGLAIARELGIAQAGDRVVDGRELERMSEAELHQLLPRVAVFARVQPAQKLRIVQALQARGEVVAMTGDGVNDAPALARADVGVAMGQSGTEVAKSAAKVVVTDDDFATIVAAVEQGRVIYGNLKKVILFLFATSVDEVLILLLALLAGLPLPLAAVQILWINLVTEATLTLNLVMEPPSGDEMARAPHSRDGALLDAAMLMRAAAMAAATVAIVFGWFSWRLAQGADEALVRCESFTLLAMCQWFNVLNCRSQRRSAWSGRLWRNPWLLGGLAVSVALQAAVLYAPALNRLFHTQALPPSTLALLLVLASGVLWVEEARKSWQRRSWPRRARCQDA
ncbi:cation-translocating P-type ATPase [Caldimonas sp. KR1-144]|uniref:cation-translocating P-type ATPase n=1 Tax=Caldimonas sp. KR1-144 TaxID=3400911 RepID=UPI003BFAB906